MTWRSGRLIAEGLAQAGNRPVNQVGTRPPGRSQRILGGEECDTLSIARPLVQSLVPGLVTDIESASRGPSRGAPGAIGALTGLGIGKASVLILAFGAETT